MLSKYFFFEANNFCGALLLHNEQSLNLAMDVCPGIPVNALRQSMDFVHNWGMFVIDGEGHRLVGASVSFLHEPSCF
jgi:hypothetical protein